MHEGNPFGNPTVGDANCSITDYGVARVYHVIFSTSLMNGRWSVFGCNIVQQMFRIILQIEQHFSLNQIDSMLHEN